MDRKDGLMRGGLADCTSTFCVSQSILTLRTAQFSAASQWEPEITQSYFLMFQPLLPMLNLIIFVTFTFLLHFISIYILHFYFNVYVFMLCLYSIVFPLHFSGMCLFSPAVLILLSCSSTSLPITPSVPSLTFLPSYLPYMLFLFFFYFLVFCSVFFFVFYTYFYTSCKFSSELYFHPSVFMFFSLLSYDCTQKLLSYVVILLCYTSHQFTPRFAWFTQPLYPSLSPICNLILPP